MQEMDNVRVTVEKKPIHEMAFIKVCMDGFAIPNASKGYWLVNFPQCGEKDDIAEISIKEEDLEVVRILDARVNEQIKAQFEKKPIRQNHLPKFRMIFLIIVSNGIKPLACCAKTIDMIGFSQVLS